LTDFAIQYAGEKIKANQIICMKKDKPFIKTMHPYMVNRIAKLPQLKTFVSRAQKILSKDFPNSFWNCKTLFEDLIKSDFVTNLINYELSCLVNDGLYTISDSSPTGFFLVHTDKFRLAISVFELTVDPDTTALAKLAMEDPLSRKDMLYSLTAHQMMGVRGNGSFQIEHYRQCNPYPIEILDKTRHLTPKEIIEINSSEIRCFKAHEDIIKIIEPSEISTVFFFMTNDLGSIRWEYDPETRKPTRAIATSMNSSRLQWAAECLSELECVDSVSAFEKLYKHPDHFVRWSAISNLIQLDLQKGISLLKKASVNDGHPHVRDAAQRSLKMLLDGN